MKKKKKKTILLIFGEQNSPVISNSNIKLGKISTSPSPFFLPLLGTQIDHSKNTQKRHQKVLTQRIPDKPNIPISHQIKKPKRVDPRQITRFRHPFPRIDVAHVVPLVPQTVPSVAVKRARLVVDGSPSGIENPMALIEIACIFQGFGFGFGVGWSGDVFERLSWRRRRRMEGKERGVEKDERKGDEEKPWKELWEEFSWHFQGFTFLVEREVSFLVEDYENYTIVLISCEMRKRSG